jgi:exopolysaccharide production protein ExoQ
VNSTIASLICACGIAALLYLDREKADRTSLALWLPGIWIGIVGSRSLSSWFGVSPVAYTQTEGSPLDAAFYGVLLAVAIVVLIRRRAKTRTLLRASWPILIYFVYCLISVAWSYHSDISFKRWIKAIGDVAMVLIIATDPHPVVAIRRLVSRLGMLLFPTSVLFIKYYGDLGRGYTSDGLPMNTGVTTNKNMLGLIVLVVSLVVLWNVRWLLIHKDELNRSRRLIAQGILLAFGVTLLVMAQSSTSKACFILGGFLIVALNFRAIKRRPARVHAVCVAILLVAGVSLLVGEADVASALGRESNMSGRTDIWAAVIPTVPSSMVGAGFESYWISPGVLKFQRTLLDIGWYPPLVEVLNEAHNGYIEVYLNLGWIGICLLALVLIAGYRRAVGAFRRNPELGSLFLAYIVAAVFYSITEAGFRMMNPIWIFLLLAIVSANGVEAGLFGREKRRSSRTVSRTVVVDELIPEPEVVRAARPGFEHSLRFA